MSDGEGFGKALIQSQNLLRYALARRQKDRIDDTEPAPPAEKIVPQGSGSRFCPGCLVEREDRWLLRRRLS
ncbi:hypothetical protein [Amycolatopsis orientalis]|uniref:hypothetical protein n=1 Tax=Amycolatopsis orientalis TaxID=31958 RepID=UPI0012688471|nr:hypothetical protein [Amycolatopsis orientalis]